MSDGKLIMLQGCISLAETRVDERMNVAKFSAILEENLLKASKVLALRQRFPIPAA